MLTRHIQKCVYYACRVSSPVAVYYKTHSLVLSVDPRFFFFRKPLVVGGVFFGSARTKKTRLRVLPEILQMSLSLTKELGFLVGLILRQE